MIMEFVSLVLTVIIAVMILVWLKEVRDLETIMQICLTPPASDKHSFDTCYTVNDVQRVLAYEYLRGEKDIEYRGEWYQTDYADLDLAEELLDEIKAVRYERKGGR